MKKMLIVAAAAAMTLAGEAALKPTQCENCGVSAGCDTIVFKVTASGKAVVSKEDYKAVSSLKISKGALALEGTLCEADGLCCYDTGWFFATVKAGKKTFKLASDLTIGVWSVFGKNLEKIRSLDVKAGKSYSLDSALFVSGPDSDYAYDGDVDLGSGFYFAASAFGTMSVKITKASSATCNPTTGCDPIYTPKSYSGWFVGMYDCVGEEDCFLCNCVDTDVFGGTWKATYRASAKTASAAARLAGVSFYGDDDED